MSKITVYTLPRSVAGTPNPSPFCVKLECALSMAGLAFTVETIANPAVAPKGKAPFVEIDGRRIGDSTLILDMLKAEGRLDLDRDLNPRQRAESHALQRLVEERLYWVMVYSRWMEPENWMKLEKAFFSSFPFPLRYIVPFVARRSVGRRLRGHGIGLHSRDEIYALGAADLAALSDFLGTQKFFFGERPTLADASIFGLTINVIGPDMTSPLKDAALGHTNLVRHAERMGEVLASTRPREFRAVA